MAEIALIKNHWKRIHWKRAHLGNALTGNALKKKPRIFCCIGIALTHFTLENKVFLESGWKRIHVKRKIISFFFLEVRPR